MFSSSRPPALVALALVSVMASSNPASFVAADTSVSFEVCPNDCMPNGVCLENGKGCKCNPGFVGADCSFPLTMCPDGKMACFNGATCRHTNAYHTAMGAEHRDPSQAIYECDCSSAYAVSPFAGSQCEHAISDYCAEPADDPSSSSTGYDSDPDKAATNKYSFCTNGGSCLKRIQPHEIHPGCRCIGGYEGRHCQFQKGKAPKDELAYAAWDAEQHDAVPAVPPASSKGSNTAGIVSGMVIFTVVVVVAGLFAYRHRQRKLRDKDSSLEALRNDVGMSLDEEAESGRFHDVPIGKMG